MVLHRCRSCRNVVHIRESSHGLACCPTPDPVPFLQPSTNTAPALGGVAGGPGGGEHATPPPISTRRQLRVDEAVSIVVDGAAPRVVELHVDELCGFVCDWLDFKALERWHIFPVNRGSIIRGQFCATLVSYHSDRIRTALRGGGL